MCLSNEVFIDPLTDFGFKRLFGEEESKPFLISFLNDLLPIEEKIISVEYKNLEKLGATPIDRKAVYDIYCVDAKNQEFIVELQRSPQRYFIERAIYYTTFPIQEQAIRGKWDFSLLPVYFVGILSFKVDIFTNPNYIHYCQIKDETNTIITNSLNLIYIELPKFKKTYKELSKHLEYWLYFFKESNTLQEIPKKFKDDILEEAFVRSKFLNLSSRDQTEYHKDLKYLRDYYNTIDTATWRGEQEGLKKGIEEGIKKGIEEGIKKGIKEGIKKGTEEGIKKGTEEGIKKGTEEGIKKGIEEGIKKGIEKTQIEIAKKLKQKGLDDESICELTKLNLKTIKELNNDKNS